GYPLVQYRHILQLQGHTRLTRHVFWGYWKSAAFSKCPDHVRFGRRPRNLVHRRAALTLDWLLQCRVLPPEAYRLLVCLTVQFHDLLGSYIGLHRGLLPPPFSWPCEVARHNHNGKNQRHRP